MATEIDTTQRMAEALRVKLLRNMEMRKGFSRGETDLKTVQEWNAEWDVVIKDALQQARREALDEAAKVVSIYNCDHNHGKKATKACDDIVELLDRLREGV